LAVRHVAAAAAAGGGGDVDGLCRMVSSQQVFARINDRDGMVTFMQASQQTPSPLLTEV
jgi:hypothetical protein